MTGGDVGIALILALVIILIYFFIFPGLYKTNAYDLEGYWSNRLGQVYKFIPSSNWNFELVSPTGIFNGHVSGIKGVYIDFINSEFKGAAASDNRFINWNDGEVWNKQAY